MSSIPDRLRRWRDALTQELRDNGGAPVPLEARTVGVIAMVCVLLTLFFYYARLNFWRHSLASWVVPMLGMQGSAYEGLLPYLYWSCSSLTLRILIPLLCITLWFRESPRDYGFGLWKRGHGKIYAGFYLLMLPLLVAASYMPSFQRKYPFYDGAASSLDQFLLYELAYGVQFAGVEAFFRGFIVFALFKRFGYNAVLIMTIPYCMIHFNKPVPETLGAIVAGLVLGFMAVRSRSFWPGMLLHWSIGLTMDVLCIWHRGGFGPE